jgi:hypothetical protein
MSAERAAVHCRAYVEPVPVGRPGTNDKGAPLAELNLNRPNEHAVPQTPSVCATDEKYTFVDDEDALSEHVRLHGHGAHAPPRPSLRS